MKTLPLPTFKTIGVTEKSEGKVVLIRLNITPEECVEQTPAVQKLLRLSLNETEELKRYIQMDTSTKKLIRAFVVANNTLYFDDSSDYATALWEICSILHPESFPNDEDNMDKPQYIKLVD